LARLDPVSEIVDRAPAEACATADLDRAIISRVDDGWLRAESVHLRDDRAGAMECLARLRAEPIRLAYPLTEAELLRRRRPQIVVSVDDEAHRRHSSAEIMAWGDYAASPIVLLADRRTSLPLG
jgi:hypothetical protein